MVASTRHPNNWQFHHRQWRDSVDGEQLVRDEIISGMLVKESKGLLASREMLANATRLLVRRDAGLGDCLMIAAVLKDVKKDNPNLEIVLGVPQHITGLFERMPYIDRVCTDHEIFLDPKYKPAVQVDLSEYCERHRLATSIDRISIFASAFGISVGDGIARYPVTNEEKKRAVEWLAERGLKKDRKTIGIVFRAATDKRTWPIHRIAGLVEILVRDGYNAICFDRDKRYTDIVGDSAIYCCGEDITFVANVISVCDGIVTPDTGLLHLAMSVQDNGKPFVIALFGAIDPNLRMRWYNNYHVFYKESLDCTPCYDVGPCVGTKHEYQCMRTITEQDIYGAIQLSIGKAI